MKKLYFAFTLVIVATMILSACATPTPKPQTILEKLGPRFVTAYIEADSLYQELVVQETGITEAYRVSQERYSTMLSSASDQTSLINLCFEKSEVAINSAASIVFAQDNQGNPLTAEDQNKAFINALGTGTGFYAGNFDKCQQAILDFMTFMRANREAFYNTRLGVISRTNTYNLSQVKNLKIATILKFYNQYGPSIAEAIQNGEADLINSIAANNNLEPLPLDFIGFPTAALQAQSKSKAVCDGFLAYYNGDVPTPGGENPLLYQVEWNDVTSNCTMYRLAAYDYITQLFINKQAAARLDCGIDAGIGEVVDPNTCEVVTPTK